LGEGPGASRAGITSMPFPPASPPTPHDTQTEYTRFRGYTACQGLGALEYNFLAVFAAAEHTVWRRGASAQVRLCQLIISPATDFPSQ
jgi:hypothetical protein